MSLILERVAVSHIPTGRSPFLYDNDDDVVWFMDSDGFIDVDGNDWFGPNIDDSCGIKLKIIFLLYKSVTWNLSMSRYIYHENFRRYYYG